MKYQRKYKSNVDNMGNVREENISMMFVLKGFLWSLLAGSVMFVVGFVGTSFNIF